MEQNYLNLHNARRNKNDEFYTQLQDIEDYLQKFIPDFNNKYIYCNCDGLSSNFYIYFKTHYKDFNLKHLTATAYNRTGRGIRIDFDGIIETVTQLGFFDSGSFDCDACIEILKQCDIVVTNPPFSLWRQYYTFLNKYNKKFIILGYWMAFSYKEVVPDIISKKTFFSNYIPLYFLGVNKEVMCCWYNNVRDVDERKDVTFNCKYHKDIHREADNWKWLVVKKQKDVPIDYYGLVATPITFFFTKEFWNNYEFMCFDNVPSTLTEWILNECWKGFKYGIPKGAKKTDTFLDGKVQFIKLICRRRKTK